MFYKWSTLITCVHSISNNSQSRNNLSILITLRGILCLHHCIYKTAMKSSKALYLQLIKQWLYYLCQKMAGASWTQAATAKSSNYATAFGHHVTEQDKREKEVGNWAVGTPAQNYRKNSPRNWGLPQTSLLTACRLWHISLTSSFIIQQYRNMHMDVIKKRKQETNQIKHYAALF